MGLNEECSLTVVVCFDQVPQQVDNHVTSPVDILSSDFNANRISPGRNLSVATPAPRVVRIVRASGTGLGISIAGGRGSVPFVGSDEVNYCILLCVVKHRTSSDTNFHTFFKNSYCSLFNSYCILIIICTTTWLRLTALINKCDDNDNIAIYWTSVYLTGLACNQ